MEVNAFDKGSWWATDRLVRKKLNNYPQYVWFTINQAAVMPLPIDSKEARPHRMNTKSVEKHLDDLFKSKEPLEKRELNRTTEYRRTGRISINDVLDELGLEELLDLEMKKKPSLLLPSLQTFSVYCADRDSEDCAVHLDVSSN